MLLKGVIAMFDNIPYMQAASSLSREDQFVLETQYAAKQLWLAIHKLESLQAEWTARDFTNTLQSGITLPKHPAVADLGAVVYDTCNALKAVLNAGHATNVAKVL
jgi:hypothetical protein